MLLVAGAQMARSAVVTKPLDRAAPDAPPFLGSLLIGGIIGLVSGVTGVAAASSLRRLCCHLVGQRRGGPPPSPSCSTSQTRRLRLRGMGNPPTACLPGCPSGWSAWVSAGFSAHGWVRCTLTHEHCAAAAGFPVACGGCGLIANCRQRRRTCLERGSDHTSGRRSGVTSAPRDRRPSRRAPSPHGLDVVICR